MFSTIYRVGNTLSAKLFNIIPIDMDIQCTRNRTLLLLKYITCCMYKRHKVDSKDQYVDVMACMSVTIEELKLMLV